MPSSRSFLLLACVPLLVASAGCSSEETPTEPEPGTVRDAICSGGGGSGDECLYQEGYCSAACSMCFQSANERVQLQNMWACTPYDYGGGGGGAEGATCSSCQSEYTQCTQKYYRCVDLVNDCRPKFYACTDRLTTRCAMPSDFCNR